MGSTPIYVLPYPELTDSANVPRDNKSLAEAVETAVSTVAASPAGKVLFVKVSTFTTDANGVHTTAHGLGANYSAVTAWVASTLVGATGSAVILAPLFMSVDATNVKFRVFKPDGTPFTGGSVTLRIIGA